MKSNAVTVDLHIYARVATFGEIESHTRTEILRKVRILLDELGSEHYFLPSMPTVEIIERDHP